MRYRSHVCGALLTTLDLWVQSQVIIKGWHNFICSRKRTPPKKTMSCSPINVANIQWGMNKCLPLSNFQLYSFYTVAMRFRQDSSPIPKCAMHGKCIQYQPKFTYTCMHSVWKWHSLPKDHHKTCYKKIVMFKLRGFTLSYILHTRAFGTYLLGGHFTLQKRL